MVEIANNIGAWAATPVGQMAIAVVSYLIAKRFPAFQSLLWFVFDSLKVPRPGGVTPANTNPTPTAPDAGPDNAAGINVGSLLTQLLAALVTRGHHAAAADLIALAQRIEPAPAIDKADK